MMIKNSFHRVNKIAEYQFTKRTLQFAVSVNITDGCTDRITEAKLGNIQDGALCDNSWMERFVIIWSAL